MKNFLKKILIASLLLVSVINLNSATVSGTLTNGTTLAGNTGNSILPTNSYRITKVTLTSTNAGGVYVKFYDSPNHTITNLQAAYTNSTLVASNHIVLFTNILGSAENQTNSVITKQNNIVAAALVERRKLFEFTLQGGTNTLVYDPASPIFVGQGVMATNGLPVQYVIEYTVAQ